MKIREVMERLKSGEITLDFQGHRVPDDRDRIIEMYEDTLSASLGSMDGKWGKDSEVTDAVMRSHYAMMLDRDLESGESLRWMGFAEAATCSGCAQRLSWLPDGDKLRLCNHYERKPGVAFRDGFSNYPADYVCPFAEIKPYKGSIQVNGQLLIANYFTNIPDTPDDKEYDDAWSLSTVAGRYMRAAYKSMSNVAYGQMGNMSIAIYTNEAKDSILILPATHPAEYEEYESDEEYEKAIAVPLAPEGYSRVGDISLDVWRWEATDIVTLGVRNVAAIYGAQERDDVIKLDVPHGTWNFEHNYDVVRYSRDADTLRKFDYVYAKLYLAK